MHGCEQQHAIQKLSHRIGSHTACFHPNSMDSFGERKIFERSNQQWLCSVQQHAYAYQFTLVLSVESIFILRGLRAIWATEIAFILHSMESVLALHVYKLSANVRWTHDSEHQRISAKKKQLFNDRINYRANACWWSERPFFTTCIP